MNHSTPRVFRSKRAAKAKKNRRQVLTCHRHPSGRMSRVFAQHVVEKGRLALLPPPPADGDTRAARELEVALVRDLLDLREVHDEVAAARRSAVYLLSETTLQLLFVLLILVVAKQK